MIVRAVTVAALSVAVAVGLWFVNAAGLPSERQQQIVAMCDAVGEGQYDEAIESSAALVSPDPDGRTAAECRCWALLNRDRRDDCASLIDELLLEAPEAPWVPHPVLSTLVSRVRTQQGRVVEAANLARNAAAAHPHDLKLLELEILTRTAVEGQQASHAAMEARIGDGLESFPLRIAIAPLYFVSAWRLVGAASEP